MLWVYDYYRYFGIWRLDAWNIGVEIYFFLDNPCIPYNYNDTYDISLSANIKLHTNTQNDTQTCSIKTERKKTIYPSKHETLTTKCWLMLA